MMLSRKDAAKQRYLNSPEGQALRLSITWHNVALDQVSDEVLPDGFEFDGWKVVSGVFCKTAGEYKAELQKHNTDWINW